MDLKRIAGRGALGVLIGAVLATLGLHFMFDFSWFVAAVVSMYTGAPVVAVIFVLVSYWKQ